MKQFNLQETATLLHLLKSDCNKFFETISKEYCLNDDLLKLFLAEYGKNQDKVIRLLKESTLSDRLDFTILDQQYGKEKTNQLLAKAGRFDVLVRGSQSRAAFFVKQGKYLDELCKACVQGGFINKAVYITHDGYYDGTDYIQYLVKHQDWKTLIYYDEAKILITNRKFDEMLLGGPKCLKALYEYGYKDKLFQAAKNEKQIKRIWPHQYGYGDIFQDKFGYDDDFQDKFNYEIFAKGEDWEVLANAMSFHHSCPFAMCLHIAVLKDERGEEISQNLWSYLVDKYYASSEFLTYSFDNKDVIRIWFYNHVSKLTFPRATRIANQEKQYYLNAHPWYDKKRYRIGSSKWQGTLQQLTDKWNENE